MVADAIAEPNGDVAEAVLADYVTLAGPDEMAAPDGSVRAAYDDFARRIGRWSAEEFPSRQSKADLALLNAGITFTVYHEDAGTERIFPFSLVPRIVAADEWTRVELGLTQRVRALNMFLEDVYNDGRILKDGVIPTELVAGAPSYNAMMRGFRPPLGVYAHIAGCDLVRDQSGEYVVLEDNLRTPSGVSYVLENRTVMLRVAPDLFPRVGVRPVEDYPAHLLQMLVDVRPDGIAREETNAVVLTPGIYNSAYFEHSFLAQQMGIELVEGVDLIVDNDHVFLRSTSGLEPVHVVYRRVDDDFLDPDVFNPESALGVPGIMRAYQAGNVTLVNAVGSGVADDKVVYRFVPDIIRYYLGEEPVLRNVETYLAALPDDREFILKNIGDLVVKPANESGGYGVMVGPQASPSQLEAVAEKVRENPREWLAQPLLEFSTIPTMQNGRLQPRRADLRPFVLSGKDTWVMPGGLTRVALREGSYVVNSSQGGGSKDTWVLLG
jgi:uncharacterized circularly permuted ATP-grasp superfamily protein